MAKIKFSKVGNIVEVENPMIADIRTIELISLGNPVNVIKIGANFTVHIEIIYPELIADHHAAFTLNLHCLQLIPSMGAGPYVHTISSTLKPNTEEDSFDIPFTAQSPGAGNPAVYWFIATLNFGPDSDFAAYLFGPVLFVFP
ncbi:MAG: hypothetical protein GTO02_20000 [Candidatus Dadabacteria bacterium]|nr:hypothetical protein [Candidatus Dadabacteria bacterium]NIQ16581.1 hypothetical protein [Candidatus Dadabacteria bacterium]